MRVASASVTQQPARLSMDDVYKQAERMRMRTSLESRQQMLLQTQKRVRNDSGMSRPMSDAQDLIFSQTSTPGQMARRPRGPAIADAVEIDVSSPGFVTEVTVKPQEISPVFHHHNTPISIKSGGSRRSTNSAKSNNVVSFGESITMNDDNYNNNNLSVNRTNNNNRLGSAMTTYSSYVGSELACSSPRPDSEGRSLSVTRQCCEVMGPGVCCECRKLRVRMMERERVEADFPRLRVSEKNVTTSAVLKRVLPGMTQAEIQDKVARGEIARSSLLFPRRSCHGGVYAHPGDNDDTDDRENNNDDDDVYDASRIKYNGLHGQTEHCGYDSGDNEGDDDDVNNNDEGGSRNYDDERTVDNNNHSSNQNTPTRRSPPDGKDTAKPTSTSHTAKKSSTKGGSSSSRNESTRTVNTMMMLAKMKMKLGPEASTPIFFMNLRHQNSKIFQGRVNRTIQAAKPSADEGSRLHPRRVLMPMDAEEDRMRPAFVSPRKVKMLDVETTYKVFFEPPLLEKHKQVPNPSFFAGSEDSYSLPDRLPDIITFADGNMSITDPGAALNRPESSLSFAGDDELQIPAHKVDSTASLPGLESVKETARE